MSEIKKTPRSIYYILLPVTIIFNVALILGGILSFNAGLLEIALLLWVTTPITDAFLIWGMINLRKFRNKLLEEPLPNPPCLIFVGIIISVIVLLSTINIIL